MRWTYVTTRINFEEYFCDLEFVKDFLGHMCTQNQSYKEKKMDKLDLIDI